MIWSDSLRSTEGAYMERILPILREIPWAAPVVHRIASAGGIMAENKPLFFEARFAYELHLVGISATYEHRAGVGDSTVDFLLHTTPPWLVELVSLRATKASQRAIRRRGEIYEQSLTTDASDPAQSEEAEMITAEQKITEKVFANGRPVKFPRPTDALHLILTDVRGYLDGSGGDYADWRHIAYGPAGIPDGPDKDFYIRRWTSPSGRREPIKGLFDPTNPLAGSGFFQERIHFLGFVQEHAFTDGEIKANGYYLSNPHLLPEAHDTEKAYESFPLRNNYQGPPGE